MGHTVAFPPPLLCLWFCLLCLSPVLSGPLSFNLITGNLTVSYQRYIDTNGAFLASRDNTFQARITNSERESPSFYFAVVHVLSNVIVWSANRNQSISRSSQLRFTNNGLTLYNDASFPIWSTPRNNSVSISSLQLLESGNLILLDADNNTVWESFDFPTDVLLENQKLKVGQSLVSSVNDVDLSQGDYRLVVWDNDAMLQWHGVNYWQLMMDKRSFRDKNFAVKYLVMNSSGLYLMGDKVDQFQVRVSLPHSNDTSTSNFRIAKLYSNGAFKIESRNPRDQSTAAEFTSPDDDCKIPLKCSSLSVCTDGGSCQCAPAFYSDPDPKMNNSQCVPSDGSLALPGSCNGSSLNGTDIKYLNLRNDLDYFSNDFTDPIGHSMSLSACQSLCSGNCSCLGVFYSQSSGSCYMIWNYIGSFTIKSSAQNRIGFVKTVAVGSPDVTSESKESDFPILVVVLLPSSGVIAIAVVVLAIWFRRRRTSQKGKSAKAGLSKYLPSAEDEMDIISIPGLPIRFTYQELVVATEDFSMQIGSGGFGTVYKGSLQDGTEVAVKKITCLGARGKHEFLTEIAVIGKIHHVNLVKLRGFCAHGGQRFLVYEYMNRGSLDRTLFHGEPVLEWRERLEIALGTARGLAYLHSGCENTIIHCDVKPENILLHDKSPVKISDFGLSKLLSTEESGLFTTLRGTRGYLAPEWLTSSAISDKTDVYSYGMVLLELIRGKKNSSPQTQSNSSASDNRGHRNGTSSPSSRESGNRPIYFPLFALEMHEEGRYLEVVDPRLAGRVTGEEVEKLVRVALCCVHEETSLRPSMSNVVGMLEGTVALGEPRLESLNFLRFYGRRFTEASVVGDNSNQQNEMMMAYRQAALATNTSSSYNSLSYISSQQVSGPR